MPRRKYAKRRPQARRPRRVKRGARSITTVPRGLNPVSPRYICKMKYSTTATTDASGQMSFRLNGLYDPTGPGNPTSGHQPYGYDQLEQLYNRYRVISCGWRIERAAADNGAPVMVGCIPSNDTAIDWASIGGFSHLRENPRSRYMIQNPGAVARALTGKSYLPSLLGRTKAQYMAEDKCQSIVNTLPVETALLYVLTYQQNGQPLASTTLNILLEFTVEWFDQKRQVQSQI